MWHHLKRLGSKNERHWGKWAYFIDTSTIDQVFLSHFLQIQSTNTDWVPDSDGEYTNHSENLATAIYAFAHLQQIGDPLIFLTAEFFFSWWSGEGSEISKNFARTTVSRWTAPQLTQRETKIRRQKIFAHIFGQKQHVMCSICRDQWRRKNRNRARTRKTSRGCFIKSARRDYFSKCLPDRPNHS